MVKVSSSQMVILGLISSLLNQTKKVGIRSFPAWCSALKG